MPTWRGASGNPLAPSLLDPFLCCTFYALQVSWPEPFASRLLCGIISRPQPLAADQWERVGVH